MEIQREFFERDPVSCARDLIGCTFRWNGCEGRIVETEAYESEGDEACHTWNRPSARAFIGEHRAGIAYVYLNYGVHWLFNVLAKSAESSGFVLFRALEPATGIETMRLRRGAGWRDSELCSGPGRLTKALGIDGKSHGEEFLGAAETGILLGPSAGIIAGGRIGISRSVSHQWRFGELGSKSLSRKF